MKFIDERGFIFGRLNVADAVVLVALAGLVFGTVSLVYGIGQPPQQTKGVVVETPPVPDYVASEIQTGPVPSAEVVSIDQKGVVASDEESVQLRLHVTLSVEQSKDELPKYRDERLYVGRTVTLDLGRTIVDGAVVDIRPTDSSGQR
jgi:hypothetical protein